ncbi:MAG: response regulator transcription factor [Actinobacteria bacterium]|nr:response regulator transcription factor [Actinomycetota bacterium]MCL5069441.1 response regulator transcription factor [Actinomycetota bacterium]
MIKVLIVDDHPLVRHGINTLLGVYDDIEVTGEAENGKVALEMCEKCKPDIVLMDLIMPEVNGIEATKKILKNWPSIKVVTLTSFIDKKLIEDSLKAGAIGYVLKNISGDSLVATIRDADKGKSTLSSEASDFLISNLKNPSVIDYQLTSQEKNIMACLVEGLSNKKITQKLVLSLSTVKFHVSNILSKLGASNRAEAVSIAIKNKLVD